MTNAKRDFFNSIVILIVCGIAYFESFQIPSTNFGKLGAGFFPNIVIGTVIFLDLLLLVSSLIRWRKEGSPESKVSATEWVKENKKVLLTFIYFGAYIVLLKIVGFIIASVLFLYALYRLLARGNQKWWIVLPGIIVAALLVYFVFQIVLSVFLPTGILF